MEANDTRNILREARTQFFLAMLYFWSGKAKAVGVPSMPGQQEMRYTSEDNEFVIVDHFFSFPSFLSGMITIFLDRRRIWAMRYQGFHRPEDASFLEQILRPVWEKGEFIGGRGPISYGPKDGITYTNRCTQKDFRYFFGEETLTDLHGVRGRHQYSGMTYLPEN